jgi:hypothetical protein
VIEKVLNSSFPPDSVLRVGAIEPGGLRIFKVDRRLLVPPTSSLARVGPRSQ